jgi:hypothetical protein
MPIWSLHRPWTKVAGVAVRPLRHSRRESRASRRGMLARGPVRPVADAATIPSLTPCVDAAGPRLALWSAVRPRRLQQARRPAYRAERDGGAGVVDATPTDPYSVSGGPGGQATLCDDLGGVPFERNRDFVLSTSAARGSGLYCEDLDDPTDG